VFLGGALQPEVAALPPGELQAVALAELRALIGIRGEPLFAHVAAHAASMAQYHVGHAQRVAEVAGLAAAQQGLSLVGNAYDGVGIPDCIRGANDAAAKALG
jgi:oxygen-dependent protoporphyrinogen oxidase